MNYFLVKVKYTKQLENGTFARVSESYLIQAISFSDAEKRTHVELGQMIRGEFKIIGIAIFEIHDIFHYEDSDLWWKTKISFISQTEDEKPKKTSQSFLISAPTAKDAAERLNESLSTMMIDYSIKSVVESPILDIFPIDPDMENLAKN
jgi:hypothetical protein